MPAPTQEPRPLIILDTSEVSGPAKGVLQFLEHAGFRDHPHLIATFQYPGRSTRFLDIANDRGFETFAMDFSSKLDWSFVRDLQRAALARGVNVVQSHSLKPHIVARVLSRRLDVPWIAFAHGWTAETRRVHLYNVIERQILRGPDHVISVTEKIADSIQSAGRKRPIHVIENSVDLRPLTEHQRCEAEQLRRRHAPGPKSALLCVVGRLSYEKAPDLLVEALASSRLRDRDWCCLIVGDGPMRAELEAQVGAHGLREKVRFLGHVADAMPVIAAADAYCSPSRSEGVPNVVLEAASLGRAIVATKVGAVERILDQESALLVASRDVDALARAIERIVGDRRLCRVLGQNALAALGRWPTPKQRADRILGVYGEATRIRDRVARSGDRPYSETYTERQEADS